MVTVKPAEADPAGMVTAAGTKTVDELLERVTLTDPVDLDIETEQALDIPAFIRVGVQVSDDKVGLAHSVNGVVFDESPRVAVIEPAMSEEITPIVALNITLELPAAIKIEEGTDTTLGVALKTKPRSAVVD